LQFSFERGDSCFVVRELRLHIVHVKADNVDLRFNAVEAFVDAGKTLVNLRETLVGGGGEPVDAVEYLCVSSVIRGFRSGAGSRRPGRTSRRSSPAALYVGDREGTHRPNRLLSRRERNRGIDLARRRLR
jgi:hypothetical protein